MCGSMVINQLQYRASLPTLHLLKMSGLEIMPTGYMDVDGGAPTTVSYISNASPIPADKNEIAMCTAMAGEMLGMKLIYMDSGGGETTYHRKHD